MKQTYRQTLIFIYLFVSLGQPTSHTLNACLDYITYIQTVVRLCCIPNLNF